jgi:predicted transcriptional regulator YdeE
VPQAWQAIFKLEAEKKIQRTYKTDFELYDQRSQDPQNAQVDLYVGLK